MVRVKISIPDDLHGRAKEAGLNISELTCDAIVAELERLFKIEALDRYLAGLEAEHGPISAEDRARADAVLDQA